MKIDNFISQRKDSKESNQKELQIPISLIDSALDDTTDIKSEEEVMINLQSKSILSPTIKTMYKKHTIHNKMAKDTKKSIYNQTIKNLTTSMRGVEVDSVISGSKMDHSQFGLIDQSKQNQLFNSQIIQDRLSNN